MQAFAQADGPRMNQGDSLCGCQSLNLHQSNNFSLLQNLSPTYFFSLLIISLMHCLGVVMFCPIQPDNIELVVELLCNICHHLLFCSTVFSQRHSSLKSFQLKPLQLRVSLTVSCCIWTFALYRESPPHGHHTA